MKLKLELLSASELGEMVSKKEITACELLDLFLARIKEKNPSLNAFVYLKEEEAKKKAKEIDFFHRFSWRSQNF
jgi:amidase/aspartyl-tRNA(Asn)/glutamyl-tRNA(Gln) amidotransferase subunit A